MWQNRGTEADARRSTEEDHDGDGEVDDQSEDVVAGGVRQPVEPTAEMPEIRRRREAAARLHKPQIPPVTELPVDSPDATERGDDDLWDYYAPKP